MSSKSSRRAERERPPTYLHAMPAEVWDRIHSFVTACCAPGCKVLVPVRSWWGDALSTLRLPSPVCFCCYWDRYRRDAIMAIHSRKLPSGMTRPPMGLWFQPLVLPGGTGDQVVHDMLLKPLWVEAMPAGSTDPTWAYVNERADTEARLRHQTLLEDKLRTCCKSCCNGGVVRNN